MKKFSIIFFLACVVAGNIQAFGSADANEDRCSSNCYECRCEPLYECSWGVQLQGGVRPILWHQRDHFFTVNCLSTTVLNDLGELPKFSKLYHVPWQIGGQVSYATSCNTNLFVEFNYASARAKHNNIALGTSGLSLDASRYKLYDAYFGARYYFDRWFCNRVSFFLGGKIGLVHHKSVDASSAFGTNGVLCYPDFEASDYGFFRKNTVFAGGGHVGFDICLSGDWLFVITGEVVANSGPRQIGSSSICSFDAAILNDANALLLPAIGNELAFPVTFGIKYNF